MSVRRTIARTDPSTVDIDELCAQHGLHRSTYYRLRKRFLAGGDAALEPRSRAPKKVANRTPFDVEEMIVAIRKDLTNRGLDAGPQTIEFHLRATLGPKVKVPAPATIYRILERRGKINVTPRPKRRTRWRRFSADRANECWQIDATHWHLRDGTLVEIINVIDDCSRAAMASLVTPTTTAKAAWQALTIAASKWGWPERLLRDNGQAFKALAGQLAAMGIVGKHSRPYHPQTCGKVERFHQTLKLYLEANGPFDTIEELQSSIDWFIDYYNHQRPHRAIGRQTPASVWHSTPKSGPCDLPVAITTTAWNNTVHNGRVKIENHRITVGAQHTGDHVTALVTGDYCHVFDNDGHLIRKLVLDRSRYNQPLHPNTRQPKTQPA